MSMFNSIVPMLSAGRLFLVLIDWDESIGRIRYCWASKDGTEIYVLFKDGPDSWSDNKELVEKTAREHYAFKDWKVVDRDNVYVIATFDVTKFVDSKREIIHAVIESDVAMSKMEDEEARKDLYDILYDITTDPFYIFDARLKELEEGKLDPKLMDNVNTIAKKINDGIESGNSGIIEV